MQHKNIQKQSCSGALKGYGIGKGNATGIQDGVIVLHVKVDALGDHACESSPWENQANSD